jgi:hypothetical protein
LAVHEEDNLKTKNWLSLELLKFFVYNKKKKEGVSSRTISPPIADPPQVIYYYYFFFSQIITAKMNVLDFCPL